jgi:hypothetical protein
MKAKKALDPEKLLPEQRDNFLYVAILHNIN